MHYVCETPPVCFSLSSFIKDRAEVIDPRREACLPGSHRLPSFLSKMDTFFQGTSLHSLISSILGYPRMVENIRRNFGKSSSLASFGKTKAQAQVKELSQSPLL